VTGTWLGNTSRCSVYRVGVMPVNDPNSLTKWAHIDDHRDRAARQCPTAETHVAVPMADYFGVLGQR
jgi:hypothetical protein